MKLVAFGVVCSCFVWACAAPGQDKGVRKELEATLLAITTAVQHKDASFASYLANDFTSTEANGKVHLRAEVMREWTTMMQQFKDFKWQRHIKTLRQQGPIWVTVTESHLSAKVPGRDGKQHAFTFDATSQDRWEKMGGKWKDHGAKVLKSVAKVDGRATPMG